MIMDTAGALKEGQIVWALADVKEGFKLFGEDEVRGYLLFSNPHIYGKSIDIKFVLERVVCNNTLTMALAEKGQPSVKVNHRREFNADEVKHLLGALDINAWSNLKRLQPFLAKKRYTDNDFERFLGQVFGTSNKEGKKLSRTGERASRNCRDSARCRIPTWDLVECIQRSDLFN